MKNDEARSNDGAEIDDEDFLDFDDDDEEDDDEPMSLRRKLVYTCVVVLIIIGAGTYSWWKEYSHRYDTKIGIVTNTTERRVFSEPLTTEQDTWLFVDVRLSGGQNKIVRAIAKEQFEKGDRAEVQLQRDHEDFDGEFEPRGIYFARKPNAGQRE